MKIWIVEYGIKDDTGVWIVKRVIAETYQEAAKKATESLKATNESIPEKYIITKIAMEDDELDAI
jgi:hypothetical protein